MFRYKLLDKKGEGTFSEVIKAQNIETGTFHAIKCMKQRFANVDEVNRLREIQSLRRLSTHPNVVILHEVLFDKPSGKLALVFELLSANLYEVIRERERPLSAATVQSYARQIFTCLAFIHERGIFHRDLKPENILVDKSRNILKLADFGSVRGIHSQRPYTEYISTRWYRAPECLLTDGEYGAEVDIWGAGCVIFEIIALNPLFPGADEIDQINRIHKILGSPPPLVWMNLKLRGSRNARFDFPIYKGSGFAKLIPRARQDCIAFLHHTLKYSAKERISAAQALAHSYLVGSTLKPLDEAPYGSKLPKNIEMRSDSVRTISTTISSTSDDMNKTRLTNGGDFNRVVVETSSNINIKDGPPSLGMMHQSVSQTKVKRQGFSSKRTGVATKKIEALPLHNNGFQKVGYTEEKQAKQNYPSNASHTKESLPTIGKPFAPPLRRKQDISIGGSGRSTTNIIKNQSIHHAERPTERTTKSGLLPPLRAPTQRDRK